MAKRAGISWRARARLFRVALARTPVLRAFYNSTFLSDLSAWRSIFGQSVNAWGVHGDAFGNHPLVYRAITLIHNAASGPPLLLSRQQGTQMVTVTAGPEWQALNRPSAGMSRAALIGATAGLMQCDEGEAFWVIIRAGEARAIAMLYPPAVHVEREKRTGTLIYRVSTDEGQKILEEKDVIHFKTFNPGDPLRGKGPLAAARHTVTDDMDIRTHNRQMVRNGGLYRPVLMTDEQLPEKGSPEDVALEEQLTKLLGSPNARGKVVVLPNGLKLSDHSKTVAEMDYLESRKQNVKEIAGVFGVPPSKLGDYERDQADSEAQERDFWNDTMTPLLRYIADKIETDLWKVSGLARAADTGINVGFDLDTVPVLVRQKQSLWAGDTQDVQSGIVTINEVRRRRGLPDVPWGDVWWSVGLPIPITSGEMPELPGFADPDPRTEDDEDDDEEEDGKGLSVVDLRSAAARIRASGDRDEIVLAGFVLLQSQFEGAAIRAMRGVLGEIEDEVLGNIRAAYKSVAVPEVVRKPGDVTELLFDVNSAAVRTGSALRRPLRDAQAAGGRRGLRLARSSATFSVDAAPAIEYLARQTQRYAKPVAETTWQRLKDSLSEGLQRGEGERELTGRVKQVMEVRRAQAAGVARTEVNAAANGGVELGFRQSGVVARKRWLTAGDGNVRDSHKRAHGQTVAVDAEFRVGGHAMAYPGDPQAPLDEVMECRCTIEPILKRG